MNSKASLSAAVRRLLLLAAALFGLLVTARAQPFEARFENDATGMWLVYPTVPGWHYRIESGPATADTDLTFVAGSFRYGNGSERRWWIAPPPPPVIAPDPPLPPPPPRFLFSARLYLHISSDTSTPRAEVVSYDFDGEKLWAVSLPPSFPVPTLTPPPAAIPNFQRLFFVSGNSPTSTWLVSGVASRRPLAEFESAGGDSFFEAGSTAAAEFQFVTSHWDEIVGDLTPHPDDASLDPPPPPYGTPASPPPDPSVRRFFRVKQTAIDTNGNGLWDWWELQNGYSAFATSGPTFADPAADPDHDGLTNLEEYELGTNPHNRDTDGDLSPEDGEERDRLTDPLDDNSTPSVLVCVTRELIGDMVYQVQPPGWTWIGSGHLQVGPGPSDWVTGINIFFDGESLNSQGFVAQFPTFSDWKVRLGQYVPFPELMPDWAPAYAPGPIGEGHHLPEGRAGGYAEPRQEESEVLRHQRLWLRGPIAPPEGTATKMLLIKEHTSRNSQGTWTDDEPVIEEVIFTTLPGERVSSPVDLKPSLPDQDDPGYTYPASQQAEFVSTIVSQYDFLLVDADMNGVVEPGADIMTTDASGHAIPLKASEKGLILDINNNNTDGGTGSANANKHDHLSQDIDSAEDQNELLTLLQPAPSPVGHLKGDLVIRLREAVWKTLSKATETKKYKLYLRRTGEPCVRVHHATDTESGLFKRRVIGIATDTDTNGNPDDRMETWIPSLDVTAGNPDNEGYRAMKLVMEGISAGLCDIVAEIRLSDSPPETAPVWHQSVRVQVNVDQLPDPNLSNKAGISLVEGENRHYLGMDFGDALPNNTDEGKGIYALRGRFLAEIPAYRKEGINWTPQLTHKHDNQLRLGTQTGGDGRASTASFWFNLSSRPVNVAGAATSSCWVQAGVILSQNSEHKAPNLSDPTGIRVYLESGRRGYLQEDHKAYATDNNSKAIAEWFREGIAFDFVLFQVRSSSENVEDSWHLVCRDARTPDSSNYFHLSVGPPKPGRILVGNEGSNIRKIHRKAIYAEPEFKTELINSVSFLFGTESHPGIIENLQFATEMEGEFRVAEGGGDEASYYYHWATENGDNDARFQWLPLHPKSGLAFKPSVTLLSGWLTVAGAPETRDFDKSDTTAGLGFWHVIRQTNANGLEQLRFYDDRNWAFPLPRR